MIMEEIINRTIGDIVARDFRAATIFKEAGIDFCCGGKMTLHEACTEKGIDVPALAESLENIETKPGMITHKFSEWQPGFLCDYIVTEHHSYIRKSLPDLEFYTRKIADVHGKNHPELMEVADLFSQISSELQIHMKKEENILFPAIKDLFGSNSGEAGKTVKDEIDALMGEHEFAGGAMDRINTVTDGYKLPEDACNSYRLTFEMLEKFEDDLHTHVHLENNILIPKTLGKL
jgi:regulator of cell morphogenesis and NO signaling